MTEELKAEVTKPSDRLTINVNGKDQEIFMSGGLIRTIVPYVENSQTAAEIFGEAALQNEIIVECVRPRTKSGEPKKNFTIDDFEITTEDSNKLVAWVTEHVLYFFIDSMTTVYSFGQKNQAQIQKLMKLMQSQAGSQNLQEPSASVGPST